MGDPATNTTIPGDPPQMWMPEPNQRGTFGIISLCFSTLIICTWNTLHFNIPTRRYSDTRRFFLQVFWMIVALLTPELLLYLAINERISAYTVVKQVLAVHPHLTAPGLFDRIWEYIGERLEWIFVSSQCPYVI